ncbi:MAG: exodeoxyribonuclease VII small subunit [Prosthecobacter sp.]|jgi:exodeoxyribonuclease VII small subunit|nr:exodeoxyribonuclease VII small subunit [Prosthecobacter sp.]
MPDATPQPELTFEEAISRLDEVVAGIETDGIPLEEMVSGYEEGMKLLKTCERLLSGAQRRVEMVTRDLEGRADLAEFQPAAPTSPAEPKPPAAPRRKANPSPAVEEGGEIRLF